MLHHVELYVSDLARSLRFWTPLFGLLDYREFQRWPEGVSYMHGDTYLCLVQAPQQHLDAGYHRQRVGLNHLAFHGQSRAIQSVTTRHRGTSSATQSARTQERTDAS